MRISTRRVAAVTACAALSVGVAACGGAEQEVSSAAPAAPASTVKLTPDPPTTWPGPSSSPKPQAGKKIAIVSCTLKATSVLGIAKGVREAAQAMGWKVISDVDAKNDPTTEAAAIQNAVINGADGIVDNCVPPAQVQAALRFAKKKGVAVVNTNDVLSTDPLIAANQPLEWQGAGRLLGDWIVRDSGGTAKVVVVRDSEYPGNRLRDQALIDTIKACKGCTLVDAVEVRNVDAISPKMGSLVRSLNDRHGKEMQYLALPYGALWSFAEGAVKSLGRDDLKVGIYEGDTPEVKGCQNGLVDAISALDIPWFGWATADQLNRVLNGDKGVDQHVPTFLVTQKNCDGLSSASDAVTYDFRAQYKKLWGV